VALYVDALQGFDPLAQVKAWGGTTYNWNMTVNKYAGPGTVFIKTQGQTWGRLVIDSGEEANGTDRLGLVTPLPALGSGAVATAQAQGSDLWVTAAGGAGGFKDPWAGGWMELADATGAVLGTYRVLELGTAGQALLADGAPAAATAATFRGLYRFDRIDIRNGAGLSATDEIRSGVTEADGKARLPRLLTTDTFTLKSGAQAVVASGDTLRMNVTGTLTIEATAILDATGGGYPGTATANGSGGAPAGVSPAKVDAGGSHGGVGSLWTMAGPAGEVFDSVYLPALGGGGGSLVQASSNRRSGAGGGVIDLTAGTLVLNGEIRSKGEMRPDLYSDSPGAGGSVLVHAGTLSGSGLIDVSGGHYTSYNYGAGSAGGGRAALYVTAFSGFDPLTQVKARGGTDFFWNGTVSKYAGPGTVFVKQPAQTYGRLIVDQGGIGSFTVPNTPLPSIGTGAVGTATADTADANALWIEPADANAKFALGVVGLWVRVAGVDYPVLAQSADRRRLLLGGAASAVSTGASYRGVYKFDEVVVRGGAKLEFRDTNAVTTWSVDSSSQVIQNVTP
jgi:hypothetical protein